MVSNSIISIEALQSWFFNSKKHGYISIYRGFEKLPKERISVITYDSLDDGWNQLSRLVMDNTAYGGLLTIYLTDKESDNNGFTVRYNSSQFGNRNEQSSISGINSESIGAIVSKEIDLFKKDFLKDQEIADLKMQLQEKNKKSKKGTITGLMSEIGEAMEENPTLAGIITNIASAFIAKFMSSDQNQMPAISGPPKTKIDHIREADSDQNLEESEEYSEIELERIAVCLEKLKLINNDPIYVLEKISNFIEKNPDQAKSLLTNL